MRVKAALVAALLSFTLSACGTSERPDVVNYPKVPSPTAKNPQQKFLDGLKDQASPAIHTQDQTELIQLGNVICGAIGKGAPYVTVVKTLERNGFESHDAAVMTTLSYIYLCPGVLDRGTRA